MKIKKVTLHIEYEDDEGKMLNPTDMMWEGGTINLKTEHKRPIEPTHDRYGKPSGFRTMGCESFEMYLTHETPPKVLLDVGKEEPREGTAR